MYSIELAHNIRKLNKKVKIFLITAFQIDDSNKNKDFSNAGIELVIEKPIHLKKIKENLVSSFKIT
jgi:response regulator RpfG family c-di-GMP phosphodiesterase